MKSIYLVLSILCFSFLLNSSKPPIPGDTKLTVDQRIWGLMQIWSAAKYNFAYFDRNPNFDWDAEAQQYIPKVMNAKDTNEYYRLLQQLAANLNDGHSYVMTPDAVERTGDMPPVEFQFIEEKIILTRIGDTPESNSLHLQPGWELMEVDGIAAGEYFDRNFASIFGGGTPQWRKAMGMSVWLTGEKNSRVHLTLLDRKGKTHRVSLTRNAGESRDGPFLSRIFSFFPLVEKKIMEQSFVYFRLSSFFPEEIVEQFNVELERLDLAKIKGMILDLRFNMGGNSQNGYRIISRLIQKKLKASRWKTRKYLPYDRAWGEPEQWQEGEFPEIEPTSSSTYSGPLAILIGPYTCSAAEDFLVPLDYADRAVLIGETTAGSTGQPLITPLPGGGLFSVCTVKSFYPDGKEFVGLGIKPGIEVKPSQEDIYRNHDRALEKAVAVLKSR